MHRIAERGVVESFDEYVGLGVIRRSDGSSIGFHCLEIEDGTRTIPIGTAVVFGLQYRFGRVEASAIVR